MEPLKKINSIVIPLLVDNIDTDQILPARFLKITNKDGLGEKLFYDWRYDENGNLKQDFVLNKPQYKDAKILLAGDNFGCGSSREHAPWALSAFGIKVIVSTSIADIFRNNAMKNGMLPIVLKPSEYGKMKEDVQKRPFDSVTVDLEKQEIILASGSIIRFDVDQFAKYCLMNGIDELQYIMKFTKEIEQYEKTHTP